MTNKKGGMRVVSVNVPEDFLILIAKLVGNLYPSRSELIRCAVREFLLKELKLLKKIIKAKDSDKKIVDFEDFDPKNYVRIPIDKIVDGKVVRQYNIKKVVRSLDDYGNG